MATRGRRDIRLQIRVEEVHFRYVLDYIPFSKVFHALLGLLTTLVCFPVVMVSDRHDGAVAFIPENSTLVPESPASQLFGGLNSIRFCSTFELSTYSVV